MTKNYETNFFFPKSAFAKDNNKLIATIVIVWALAVFGFHGFMKAIEKPVPEENHIVYMAAVEALKAGTASIQQKQDVAKVYLTLMGRYINLRGDADLQNAFTVLANGLLLEGQKIDKADLTNLITAINFKEDKVDVLLKNLVPYAISDAAIVKIDYNKITPLMDKYLIHYRSFLTDTIFLGFPFHYFYSAIFSMVLFCGLCIFYCLRADKMTIKHGIESDKD